MGGHAFRNLHCPRISGDVYAKVKLHTTEALQTIFSHVTVPTEMPEKVDYGDIDFLVAGPLHSPASTTIDNFDWAGTVSAINFAFDTTHGRRGHLNPGCMYFAIRAPGHEDEFWVQVDVKVCFKTELFEWQKFELNYASNSKMIGSMVKPLGLTIDPEGLHIRVAEIEETNFPGSMVCVSKDPRDVLRITGLDRRILDAGFITKDEIYEYFAGSWLFHPGHFAARLAEENYNKRLDDRSPHWTYFIREWVPKHYPDYKFPRNSIALELDAGAGQSVGLQTWYDRTRAAVRDEVFTMFPHIANEYYTKRAAHVKEQEEQRLRAMIMAAIPDGNTGWKDDFTQPHIIIRQPEEDPSTPVMKPAPVGELTPPLTPTQEAIGKDISLSDLILPSPVSSPLLCNPIEPWNVPLYLDPLPRAPPIPCTPYPPPEKMSIEAKLLCLARWTLFDPTNGTPYLLSSPRDRDFEMHWTDATFAGATEVALIDWAKEMWWHIWIRQSHTNYVGMWKKRFEKEEKKAEKKKLETLEEDRAEAMKKAEKEEILARLEVVNMRLGLGE